MIGLEVKAAVDGLRYARDRQQHLDAILRMCDTPEEFRLYRDLKFAPVPRGESPDETVDALARKALALRALKPRMGVNAAVFETVPQEDHESLFNRVLKRAYHLNQKRKAKKRPPLKG